ncbi:putative membrane protein YesL [Gracilibacillus halotolerans]|uniref:Putative membrane protein YesL n=1 Tax=Gracilibacillus halotolerans TaxID=74386 RepID=A0A841RHX6_9BACI|nr:YesL family protein [Gracilibacillus halotolerans]MBB6512261.1 putative membrane protein YesL [Gracilibacillus halotolerans]
MEQGEALFFRILYVVAAFSALQFFWLFFSLGVVTVIPATMAMYAVLVEWQKNGVDIGIWKTFFPSFKAYFRRTVIGSMNLLMLSLLIAWNFQYVQQLLHTTMYILLFMASLIVLTLISVVPFTVTSHLKGFQLWKNASLVSVAILPQLLIILLLIGLYVGVTVITPVLGIAIISVFAYLHLLLWQRAVKKLPSDLTDRFLLKYRYR